MAKSKNRKSSAPVAQAVSDCNSPILLKRLARIAENYDSLHALLSELEERVPQLPESGDEDSPPPKLPR
ncbi:MAG: hypothetical protein GTO41_08185 [Burkholderiales bacterium]|nr:hypothetical protein [Burkholderiales bacterium]